MALEMRGECERCRQQLGHEDVAFVCSLECTFCGECAEVLTLICPNCAGELSRRPRRRSARSVITPAGSLEQMLTLAGQGSAAVQTAGEGR